MNIPLLIIQDRPPLNRFLGHRQVDHNCPGLIRRCRLNRQLQRIQYPPRIPIGHIHQMFQGRRVNLHIQRPISPLLIRQRLLRNLPQIIRRQRLQLENPAPADQSLIHFKIGILRCRPDQNNRPFLHMRQ